MKTKNRLLKIALIFFLSTLSSCVTTTFTNYPGDTPSDQQAAILSGLGIKSILKQDGTWTSVYGRSDRWISRFQLLPGTYVIEYSWGGQGVKYPTRIDTVELKAGHTYRAKNKACFFLDKLWGSCWGRGDHTGTVWIEDRATGQVVAGEKWD
jgi:hypothetical protein